MVWQNDINKLLEIENSVKIKTNNKLVSFVNISIEQLNFYLRKRVIRDCFNKRWYILKRGLKKYKAKKINSRQYDMFYDCPANHIANSIDQALDDNVNYFFFRIKDELNIFFIDNYNAQYLYNRRKSDKLFYIVYTVFDDRPNGGCIANKVLYILEYNKYLEKGYFK